MVVKRKVAASKRKPRSCQPMELNETELRLLEGAVSFHSQRVKALQELTKLIKQLLGAKKHREQLFTSPGGRLIRGYVQAAIDLTQQMNQPTERLLHELRQQYRIPAAVRRSMSRTAKASMAKITHKVGR